MLRVQEQPPGKLVASVITSSRDALADCVAALERRFGRVECETGEIPCQRASALREEMGDSLLRHFFSFEQPVKRGNLPEIKMSCGKIEQRFADHLDDFHFRTVKVDPGILTPDNLVMASCHELNHRIYLSRGVFAEMVLIYSQGCFMRLPWTDPDFCHKEVIDLASRVRSEFTLVGQG